MAHSMDGRNLQTAVSPAPRRLCADQDAADRAQLFGEVVQVRVVVDQALHCFENARELLSSALMLPALVYEARESWR